MVIREMEKQNMKTLCLSVFCALLAVGCQSTRSISYYQQGYNPSYMGELSEVEFVKDISSGQPIGAADPVRILKGDRVIVMQSGQIRPDAPLLAGLVGHVELVPMSGMPSKHAVGGPSLRDAALSGGVTKILAHWGSIETSVTPKDTKIISWVPIVGWHIPDNSQKMRVSVSAIIADVSSGQWSSVTALSDETVISHSMMSARTKDSKQVAQLKAQAYLRLVESLATR